MNLRERIKKHEGFETNIYEDILGFATVGYGFLVSALAPDELALNGGKVEPMSREAAEAILDLKLEKLDAEVDKKFQWLASEPQNVREVILEMCYQMNPTKVAKFATTLHYIRSREYERAVANALKSTWARQTPERAREVLKGLVPKMSSEEFKARFA